MNEGDEERDSLDFTPQMALNDVQKNLNGRWKDNLPTKALVILLWDDDSSYSTSFFNAGLSTSQCVALLAKMQYDFLKILTGEVG